MKSLLTIPILLLLLFSSCNRNDTSAQEIPEEKFVRFYSDLLILENEIKPAKPDTIAFKRRIDSLYHAYNIDSAAVDKTIKYYNGDIARWKGFYEKVTLNLQIISKMDTTQKGVFN
jgi:hypothetical protein